MSLLKILQTGDECGCRAALVGERTKIGEQAHGPVVAGRVPAFDFRLDLAPGIIAPTDQRIESGALRLCRFLLPLLAFRRSFRRCRSLTDTENGLGPLTEHTGCAEAILADGKSRAQSLVDKRA